MTAADEEDTYVGLSAKEHKQREAHENAYTVRKLATVENTNHSNGSILIQQNIPRNILSVACDLLSVQKGLYHPGLCSSALCDLPGKEPEVDSL